MFIILEDYDGNVGFESKRLFESCGLFICLVGRHTRTLKIYTVNENVTVAGSIECH